MLNPEIGQRLHAALTKYGLMDVYTTNGGGQGGVVQEEQDSQGPLITPMCLINSRSLGALVEVAREHLRSTIGIIYGGAQSCRARITSHGRYQEAEGRTPAEALGTVLLNCLELEVKS